ncbi:uncharacterized protein LAESUDRAFT_720963, partial [Laetiporus sulphureus 93-53]
SRFYIGLNSKRNASRFSPHSQQSTPLARASSTQISVLGIAAWFGLLLVCPGSQWSSNAPSVSSCSRTVWTPTNAGDREVDCRLRKPPTAVLLTALYVPSPAGLPHDLCVPRLVKWRAIV